MGSNQSRCPNCNAVLTPDFSRRSVMCEQCETLFPVSLFKQSDEEEKENTTDTEQSDEKNETVQDAAENDDTPSETEDEAEAVKENINYTIPILIFTLIVAVAFCIGLNFYVQRQRAEAKAIAMENGWISAGSSKDYKEKHYSEVEEELESLGFENIEIEEIEMFGLAKKIDDKICNIFSLGLVTSVSIDGNEHFTKYDYFPPDSEIIIYYSP